MTGFSEEVESSLARQLAAGHTHMVSSCLVRGWRRQLDRFRCFVPRFRQSSSSQVSIDVSVVSVGPECSA